MQSPTLVTALGNHIGTHLGHTFTHPPDPPHSCLMHLSLKCAPSHLPPPSALTCPGLPHPTHTLHFPIPTAALHHVRPLTHPMHPTPTHTPHTSHASSEPHYPHSTSICPLTHPGANQCPSFFHAHHHPSSCMPRRRNFRSGPAVSLE